MIYFDGNTGVVHLQGATTVSLETGLPVFLPSGATVTFRVQTLDNVDVGGHAWPVTMSFLPQSTIQGHYIGVLNPTLDVDTLQEYLFVGDVDFGGQAIGHWEEPFLVHPRRT